MVIGCGLELGYVVIMCVRRTMMSADREIGISIFFGVAGM